MDKMLSKLFNKRMGIVVLAAVMLLILSACSGTPQGGEVGEPADQPDTQQVENKGDESPDTDMNPDQPGEEPTPEDILKGYSYSKVNLPIKDFELEDLQGNTVRLSDLKGKIVFLNFWATWCPPCRNEMPHMQAFYEKYQDDMVVLAVNPNKLENQGFDDSEKAEERAREYVEEEGFTFPVLLDRDDSVWDMYRQRGIPANYMIDREGTIRYLKPGAFLTLKEMEAFAAALELNP
ncbi:MAG TPA: redoxin domain-containing protein [Clostridiales bacterium]|nr:redoxin domain-containing protein [Clostridiales bacterium]